MTTYRPRPERLLLLRQLVTAAENAYNVAAKTVEAKTIVDTYVGEYEDSTRADYWTNIYESAYDYLTSSGAVTRYKNAARRAIVESFPTAFYSGYADAGGEETEDEDESWLTARMNKELGFVDALFMSLRELRESEGFDKDSADAQASERADGYRATLDSVYAEGKLRGAGNLALTWRLGATEKHCSTCSGLDGQRHGAKWWLKKGYKPREPGSETLECRGFNCDCILEDDKGNEYTI